MKRMEAQERITQLRIGSYDMDAANVRIAELKNLANLFEGFCVSENLKNYSCKGGYLHIVKLDFKFRLKVNSWGKTSEKCFAPAFLIGLIKTHKNKLK